MDIDPNFYMIDQMVKYCRNEAEQKVFWRDFLQELIKAHSK